MNTKAVNIGRYNLTFLLNECETDLLRLKDFMEEGYLSEELLEIKSRGSLIDVFTCMQNNGGLLLEKGVIEESFARSIKTVYDTSELIRKETMSIRDYEIYLLGKQLFEDGRLLSINKDGQIYIKEHFSVKNDKSSGMEVKRREIKRHLGKFIDETFKDTILSSGF